MTHGVFILPFQVRYKTDCEELYGRILDNHNIVSSVKEISQTKTEETWKHLYPDEPYDLDPARAHSDNNPKQILKSEKCSNYDLVSAVKRQSPFFYQVGKKIQTFYLSKAQAEQLRDSVCENLQTLISLIILFDYI